MPARLDDPKESDGDVLMTLALREKHAELTCRISAEDARDPRWRALLHALARAYARFARVLRALAISLGSHSDAPVAAPIAADALFDALFERREASSVLSAIEASERATIDAYHEARRRTWPDAVDVVLARHAGAHVAARVGLFARRHHGEAAFFPGVTA